MYISHQDLELGFMKHRMNLRTCRQLQFISNLTTSVNDLMLTKVYLRAHKLHSLSQFIDTNERIEYESKKRDTRFVYPVQLR